MGRSRNRGCFRGGVKSVFSPPVIHTKSSQPFIQQVIEGLFPGKKYSSLGKKLTKIVFEKLVLVFSRIFSPLLRTKKNIIILFIYKPNLSYNSK
jgi:hypothetical protein